jgi:hypothetical protein
MHRILWLGLLMLLNVPISSFASKVDCTDGEVWQKAARGHSAEECQEKLRLFESTCQEGTAQSTSGSVNRTFAENYCLQALLNKELDRRLRPLKKKNPAQFKSEMALQKNFNLAQSNVCYELNSCDGTMYRQTRADCILSLTKWRLDQATQINLGQLTLASTTGKVPDIVAKNELRQFIDLLCNMPAEIFATKAPAKACRDSIQKSFLDAAGELCEKDP